MATTTYDLSVCSDCIALLSNGEVSDRGDRLPPGMSPDDDGGHLFNRPDDDQDDNATSRHADLMDKQWPFSDGWHVVPGNGDLGFSWGQCDGCGTRLAGDRFLAHASQDDDK